MKNKPTIVFLTGNSGCGKSTLEKNLIESFPSLFKKVVSHTTRPIDTVNRKEENGVHYHFISEQEYEELKNSNQLIQTTEYGNFRYASTLGEYDTDRPFVLIAIVPEQINNLKNQLKKRGVTKFFTIFFNISQNKITENLLKDGENKEKIEARLKRENLSEQFKKHKLVPDYEIKDSELNQDLHLKIKSILCEENLCK